MVFRPGKISTVSGRYRNGCDERYQNGGHETEKRNRTEGSVRGGNRNREIDGNREIEKTRDRVEHPRGNETENRPPRYG